MQAQLLYNLPSNSKRWLSISVGIYVALVLNLFEPFDIQAPYFMPIYHFALSTYGLVSAAITFLCLYMGFPAVAKQWPGLDKVPLFVWLVVLVFLISLSNWLYSLFLHFTISGWQNMYVPERGFAELMPKFMVIYSVWGGLCWLNLQVFPQQTVIVESSSPDALFTLYSDNQSDRFRIVIAQLVGFRTCDNYLEVFYLDEQGRLKRRLIRSSMKKMTEQLGEFESQFFRTHQSFLLNLAFIKGVNKKQNQSFVEVGHLDFDVAISKKNVKPLLSILNSG